MTDNDLKYLWNIRKGIPIPTFLQEIQFLSIASAYAEKLSIPEYLLGLIRLIIQATQTVDLSLNEYSSTINLGTKVGVDGDSISIHAPLINMTKSEIIVMG